MFLLIVIKFNTLSREKGMRLELGLGLGLGLGLDKSQIALYCPRKNAKFS